LLRKIDQSRATAYELEHVHLNFFDYTSQKPKSSDVKVSTVTCPPSFARPDIRLDINTNQDLQYFKDMFSFFEGSNFDITDIIKWHDSIDLSKYQNGIGQ
jgi:spore coat polysaccharide biosynthesis protein SpsF (cytidylyltransferase family)